MYPQFWPYGFSSGKSFHVLTVAILNARSPYVMSFVLDSSKHQILSVQLIKKTVS